MTPGEAPASAGGKWTKGPWKIGPEKPDPADNYWIDGADSSPVVTRGWEGDGGIYEVANARLIAAAPALAAALERLVERCAALGWEYAEMQDARAALRQAKGEA